MSRLFDIDFSGYADGVALESLDSAFVSAYPESRTLQTFDGVLSGTPYTVQYSFAGLTQSAREFGVVLTYVAGIDKGDVWTFRLLNLPNNVNRADRLVYQSGAWRLYHEYTVVCSIADAAWSAGQTRTITARIEGTTWTLTVDGTSVSGESAVSAESTDMWILWGGSSGDAGLGPCIASMYLDDLSTGGEQDAVGGDIYASMSLPHLDASGTRIIPLVGSSLTSAPIPSVSISGSYAPPEEVDPDTVYGSIAFMAPFPSVEISGNVIDPVMGSISVSTSAPELSLSGESLQPILGTVSADAPAPELDASGATPSVIYGDMSLDIDWLPVFALAGYVIDDSEQSATAKSVYSGIAANALRMIKSKGMAMTLRVVTTDGTYVPGSGTPAQTTTDYPVFGVLTNYKSGQVDGTLVQVGDMQVIVGGPLSPRPETGNLLHISGELWEIVAVQRVAPDGTDVIYKVQIRKG